MQDYFLYVSGKLHEIKQIWICRSSTQIPHPSTHSQMHQWEQATLFWHRNFSNLDYHTLAKSGVFLEMLIKWLIPASDVGPLLRNPRSATTINFYNYFERGKSKKYLKNARKDLKEKYHFKEKYAKKAKRFEKKKKKHHRVLNTPILVFHKIDEIGKIGISGFTT